MHVQIHKGVFSNTVDVFNYNNKEHIVGGHLEFYSNPP